MDQTDRPVMVTGAWGMVGAEVVRQLAARGVPVVACDVSTRATSRSAQTTIAALGHDARRVSTVWLDICDRHRVAEVAERHRPRTVAHLAAVLPPVAYRIPDLADRVNVEGTANVVSAVARVNDAGDPCRLVLASSVSVYGARDPADGIVDADTEVAPSERYAHHKVACERLAARAGVPTVVLRIGVVLDDRMPSNTGPDTRTMGWSIPADNASHTVDRRDCATAVANAATTDGPVEGQVLLLGGDESHRGTFESQLDRMFRALGIGGIPKGTLLPGRPGDRETWYTTAWMDTSRAQELLDFQNHPIDATFADVSADVGFRARLLVPVAPLVRRLVSRQAARVHQGRSVAAPWRELETLFGPSVRGGEVDLADLPAT